MTRSTDDVTVPRGLITRLVDAADHYGVKHLDSDDMDDEGEELADATIAMRDALAAAPPPVPDQGAWRPIETALDDGTEVLVCVTYNTGPDEWETKQWVDGLFDGDWFQFLRRIDIPCRPTHWMPLPSEPGSKAPTRTPDELAAVGRVTRDEIARLREAVVPLVEFITAYDRDGQDWTDDSSVAEIMDGPIRRDIRLGTLRRLAALSAQPTNAGEG